LGESVVGVVGVGEVVAAAEVGDAPAAAVLDGVAGVPVAGASVSDAGEALVDFGNVEDWLATAAPPMAAAEPTAAAVGADEAAPVDGVVGGLVVGAAAGLTPGSGGMAGTAVVVSAVRATAEDSLFESGFASPPVATALGAAALGRAPGDHAGASSVAAVVGVDGVADGDVENAGASLADGGAAGADAEAVKSPPISGDSIVHSPKPGGSAGSVSLIFMYRNTPTAASSVIVANGRRELTGSSS
jgi:hypothetical protein